MMKWTLTLFILLLTSAGCTDNKREQALKDKEMALAQKEQELLAKEQTLQLKEDDLAIQAQKLDSTKRIDSTRLVNTALVGTWQVEMTCTEATCPGFAVGDKKTEQWDISYQNNALVARAMADEKLVRVYTGTYSSSGVELVNEQVALNAPPSNKMVVRLSLLDSSRMAGQREILREAACRVVFDVQMQKQTK